MSKIIFLSLLLITSLIQLANAQHDHHHDHSKSGSFAPIGVMGDHLMSEGEWMVSLRHMQMNMSGNLQGDRSITDEEIVTTIPNRFSAMPNMPPTLRIVPNDMSMKMEMLGLMYAPSDNLTLMAMLNFISKDMDLTTYQGMAGTNELGKFSTSTSGLGDSKITALIKLPGSGSHAWHLNVGLNVPLGSVDENGQALTPMNMQATVRLPYAMQLGTGTWDAEPGLTYKGNRGSFAWGAQLGLVIPLEKNDEGYDWGESQKLSGWLQYLLNDAVSTSLRYTFENKDGISGIDTNIMAPVQTADPDNYAHEISYVSLGLNFVGQEAGLHGHSLGFEYYIPFDQDVDGVQMEVDNMLVFGYQYAF